MNFVSKTLRFEIKNAIHNCMYTFNLRNFLLKFCNLIQNIVFLLTTHNVHPFNPNSQYFNHDLRFDQHLRNADWYVTELYQYTRFLT